MYFAMVNKQSLHCGGDTDACASKIIAMETIKRGFLYTLIYIAQSDVTLKSS